MDDSLVETYLSARRRKRLATPPTATLQDADMRNDIVRLLACVQRLSGGLPAPEQQHVKRVLAGELKDLLTDFCFDLSIHTHRDDVDIALRNEGLLAAVNVTFDPITEVLDLFQAAGLRHA